MGGERTGGQGVAAQDGQCERHAVTHIHIRAVQVHHVAQVGGAAILQSDDAVVQVGQQGQGDERIVGEHAAIRHGSDLRGGQIAQAPQLHRRSVGHGQSRDEHGAAVARLEGGTRAEMRTQRAQVHESVRRIRQHRHATGGNLRQVGGKDLRAGQGPEPEIGIPGDVAREIGQGRQLQHAARAACLPGAAFERGRVPDVLPQRGENDPRAAAHEDVGVRGDHAAERGENSVGTAGIERPIRGDGQRAADERGAVGHGERTVGDHERTVALHTPDRDVAGGDDRSVHAGNDHDIGRAGHDIGGPVGRVGPRHAVAAAIPGQGLGEQGRREKRQAQQEEYSDFHGLGDSINRRKK